MRNLLYVCLDGLADDPIPELGNRTPLEAAATPFLDSLAQRGRTGTVLTVGPGIAPESDIGVFGILGYDPSEEHPGRGVLEAIGSGTEFRDGDLAYRVNFATADGTTIVDRRVGRDLSSEEATALAEEVNRTLRLPRATFELKATVEHRGALVIHDDDGSLSAAVTNTDPAYAKQGSLGVALETFPNEVARAEPLDGTAEATRAADLTNEFVQGAAKVLDASDVNARRRRAGRLPANLILTRDGGDHLVLGMEEVPAPRLDGSDEGFASWAALAAEALEGYDALYVHIKGPDVPAHDGRAVDKRDVIAAIDRAFFGEVLPRLDLRRTVVAVTADHATSCLRRAHTADPVPLVVSGGTIGSDEIPAFGETAAARGSLGSMRGVEVLPHLTGVLRD